MLLLLGLDGLVQALRVAAAVHEAAGELVDDEDLAVLDDVVHVALEHELRLQRLLQVVHQLAGRVGVDVLDAEPAARPSGRPPRWRRSSSSPRRARSRPPARRRGTTFANCLYASADFVPAPEMMSGVRASSMRIESTSSTMAKAWPRCTRSSGSIDHVVAQVVEAELGVRAVGDVRLVGGHGAAPGPSATG